MERAQPPAVRVSEVTKLYRSYAVPRHRLLELLSRGRRRYAREIRALDDVSFTLEKGARLGVVGENGSGKSTLLKVLAGVVTPTSGTVEVNGRVSALLELGAGFNGNLTGKDNVYQYCMFHGMTGDQIADAMPEIRRFSELGEAFDYPIKTYSSGMSVRLGFSCAVYVQPEILIVDEALAVGDAYFQNKCMQKIRSMLDRGITFVYVTHVPDAVRALCDRAIWLDHGRVRLAGSGSDVGSAYQSEIFSRMVRAGIAPDAPPADAAAVAAAPAGTRGAPDDARRAAFAARVAPFRTGSGDIMIDDIVLIDASGTETDSIEIDGEIRVRVFFHVERPTAEKAVLNLGIADARGNQIVHFNPSFFGFHASDAPPHVPHVIEFTFQNLLCPGEYGLMAGIASLYRHPQRHGQTLIENVIDHCPGGARFTVRYPDAPVPRDFWGVVHIPYRASMRALD